ncbi:MAG: hypothetical protein QGI36_03780 [Candidatus Thalassarchaeaceae archaeon]|nr:hypothetical protein [Candidatus Thalassarchaeaceae archaeon]
MREMVEKSIQLNRELSALLEKALESNKAIKIGWGKGNDPKPRNGEMGVASHLPIGARVRLLGNISDLAAICAEGGNFTLEGDASGLFGAWNRGAKLVVERECGARLGLKMEDGLILVHGSAGAEAGAGMQGGLIVVRGSAGKRCGVGMKGGTVIIMGDVASDVGTNMQGGQIIVNGRCPPPGEGAKSIPLSSEAFSEINEMLSELNIKIDSDAALIIPDEEHPTIVELPSRGVDSQFESITIVSAGNSRLHEHAPLDLLTLLQLRGEEKGMLLPLPIIPQIPSGKGMKGTFLDRQPCIVDSNPRPIDLLRISESNLHDCTEDLGVADGAVLSLDELPRMNDAELDALITLVRSRLDDEKFVLLEGCVDRISLIHRFASELDCDGTIANSSTAAHLPASAALPMMGLSAREHQLGRKGVSQGLSIPWSATALDSLVVCSAGAQFIVSNPFSSIETPKSAKGIAEVVDSWLAELDADIRGRLIEIGEDGIDQLNRRHLRALESDTANMTGIRLAGYDRPMPQWLGQ